MNTDLFQSCGHCWVFQICWHIGGSTFTASSFSIWNSSTGIPSPPLALFIVMLPKTHLTLHSRMSGSRWVITPSWLSGSWRSFLYSSSVYSCHIFLISSASVRSIPFLSFIVPIVGWNASLGSLIFLKRSLVFPILLFSSLLLSFISLYILNSFLGNTARKNPEICHYVLILAGSLSGTLWFREFERSGKFLNWTETRCLSTLFLGWQEHLSIKTDWIPMVLQGFACRGHTIFLFQWRF